MANPLPKTEKYLRNRPFLLITIAHRPRTAGVDGSTVSANTSKKGWQEVEGNLVSFEQPSLVDRVNGVHLRNCNVIIDVMNGSCVKNAFINTPDQDVVAHYLEKYRPQVAEAMEMWLTKIAREKGQMAPMPAAKVEDAVYTITE